MMMRTKRINTGIYRVTMDGLELDIVHNGKMWLVWDTSTSNWFHKVKPQKTLRDAKAAIFDVLSDGWTATNYALTKAEFDALIPVGGKDYWWKVEPNQISVGVEGTKSVFRSKRGGDNVRAMVKRILAKRNSEEMALSLLGTDEPTEYLGDFVVYDSPPYYEADGGESKDDPRFDVDPNVAKALDILGYPNLVPVIEVISYPTHTHEDEIYYGNRRWELINEMAEITSAPEPDPSEVYAYGFLKKELAWINLTFPADWVEEKPVQSIVAEELGDGWTCVIVGSTIFLTDAEGYQFRLQREQLKEFIELCNSSGNEADFEPYYYGEQPNE